MRRRRFPVIDNGIDGLRRLAVEVAELQPWERETFERLLAEETGDAWTRLPKVS